MKNILFTLTFIISLIAAAEDFIEKHTKCQSISVYADTSMTDSINKNVYDLCMGSMSSSDILRACRAASMREDTTMTYKLVSDSFSTCLNSGKDAIAIDKCRKISRRNETTMTEGFDAILLERCLNY